MINKEAYTPIGCLTAVCTFIAFWIYTTYKYDLLMAITVGWLPALVAATITGTLWPIAIPILIIWGGWTLLQ